MKTKEEILNEFGCPDIPFDENVTMYYPAILSAMEEYGKYCAKKSMDNSFREATEMLCHKRDDFTDFETWWSEFQRKEATE